jgi:type I restriction enzyme M protein
MSHCPAETRTPVILTTSQLLTTGLDAPTCRNIVLLRLVNSMVEFKQIIGRGTRVRDDYNKLIIGTVRQMENDSELVLRELEQTLTSLTTVSAPGVPLRDLLIQREDAVKIRDEVEYTRPRVQLHFRGAKVRDRVAGSEIGSKLQTRIHTNDLLLSRIDARNGAMALVPSELDGAIATNDFPVFEIRNDRVLPAYLRFCLFQPSMLRVYEHLSRGSTNRRRLSVEKLLDLKIAVPEDLDVQLVVADTMRKAEEGIAQLRELFGGMEEELEDLVGSALHYVFRKS